MRKKKRKRGNLHSYLSLFYIYKKPIDAKIKVRREDWKRNRFIYKFMYILAEVWLYYGRARLCGSRKGLASLYTPFELGILKSFITLHHAVRCGLPEWQNAYKIRFQIFRWMRSRWVIRASDCQCRSRNSLGSITASSDTAESEGRQMKQCWIKYKKNPKITL